MEKEKVSIRILDPRFNFLCEIDDYEQLYFKRAFVSFGDFEMLINKKKINTKYLQVGNILMLDTNRVALIEYREDKQGKDGESLTIKGFTLESLLSRRITLPTTGQATWTQTAPIETVIKALCAYNLGATAKTERQISEIVISSDLKRGETVTHLTTYASLSDDVKSLCMNYSVGVAMKLDPINKKFVLDVVVGTDRTQTQTKIPPIIFSSKFENISEQNLIVSKLDYKNTAITAGKGEGVGREIITVYEDNEPVTGINRREVFADIRDSAVTSAMLPQKGLEKLGENPDITTLDGTVNPYHSLVYGVDYFLGDIVTREYDGVTLDTRIVEVVENWNSDLYSLQCTFGNRAPTILDKIINGVKG